MMPRSSNYAARPYAIGYCKPPRAHQWPKGTSGNPRGQTMLSGDIAECVCNLLRQTKPPRRKRVSFGDAIAQKLLQQALKGDRLSIRDVIRLQQEYRARNKVEGWTVIHAVPVFDNEESLFRKSIERNRELMEENERLKALVNSVRALPPPPLDQ